MTREETRELAQKLNEIVDTLMDNGLVIECAITMADNTVMCKTLAIREKQRAQA